MNIKIKKKNEMLQGEVLNESGGVLYRTNVISLGTGEDKAGERIVQARCDAFVESYERTQIKAAEKAAKAKAEEDATAEKAVPFKTKSPAK